MGKSDDDSIACRYPALAAQWHPTANGGRTADTVSVAAEFSVWWLCPVGHPFRTKVKWRCASESGCPVCAGRRTRPGINDLATVDSELAAEWHATRNGELLPEVVSPGFKGRVWWRPGCGHEFERSPSARRQDPRCPVCVGRTVYRGQNDLASQRPDLAAAWDPALNAGLGADEVTTSSRRRCRWPRPCGHPFTATPADLVAQPVGAPPPECLLCSRGKGSNPRRTQMVADRPDLLALWDWPANTDAGLQPDAVKVSDNRTLASWRCEEGHTWERRPRNQRDYCKICAGEEFAPGVNDLATLWPDLAEEWHPTLNDVGPGEVAAQANTPATWVCRHCGLEWPTRIANRTARGSGCPKRCHARARRGEGV